MMYKNTINNTLKIVNIKYIQTATVTIFRSEASIVMITLEDNTVKELLKHKAIWKLKLNLAKIRKNNKWYKIVLYKLFIAVFNTEEELEILKEEIKLFNKELKLVIKSV